MVAFHAIPAHRPRYSARSDLGHDACCHHHRVAHGTYIQLGLHARGKRFPTLLRVPLSFQFLHAGIGRCHEYFPDVYLLGTGGSIFLPADRVLLHETRGGGGFQKSLYRHPVRRPRLSYRDTVIILLHENILVRDTHLRRYLHLRRGCRNHLHGLLRHELGDGTDIHGWCRKIRHVPVTYLAAGRHGRSDARVRVDTRRHHGGCRGIPRGASIPGLFL